MGGKGKLVYRLVLGVEPTARASDVHSLWVRLPALSA